MNLENILVYIDEFVEFVKPVGGLVSDFFTNMYANIPEFEKIFLIASGLAVLSVGLYIFIRIATD